MLELIRGTLLDNQLYTPPGRGRGIPSHPTSTVQGTRVQCTVPSQTLSTVWSLSTTFGGFASRHVMRTAVMLLGNMPNA